MLAMFTVLRETALVMLILLPLAVQHKGRSNTNVRTGDWVVNQNGKLESLSGKETDPNIIK